MSILMTHGYMLSGTGSNVYVQNLCRALVRLGHDVHLLCQEPDPLSYDFVNEHYEAGEQGVAKLGEKLTSYPGRCAVYRPLIGDLLPVYVYDDYPGWRVKTFLDLTEEELDRYVTANVRAMRTVLEHAKATGAVTNHSIPGPEVARRALTGTGVPYASIVHGSCLQYVARRSARYMEIARGGLSGARSIVVLSAHSAGTIAQDFPLMFDKTTVLPGGVDTGLFGPDTALDAVGLTGGPGRGPEQAARLAAALDGFPETGGADEMAGVLAEVSASYEPRRHDSDAGPRMEKLHKGEAPVVVYVGKLIHSKGVHSLISAFARMHRRTGAKLLVIGYGTFREGLEALTHALSTGNRRVLDLLRAHGQLFEGGPSSPLERFTVSDELLRDARGMADDVEFVGPLYHAELPRVLPAAEVGVAPSIFPETFGLVAAELAASGVPPLVANHSGLAEAGAFVGRGLPFDPRVSFSENFDEDLARALSRYLALPEEERQLCRETVRRNAVDDLSWDSLAGRIARLAGEKG